MTDPVTIAIVGAAGTILKMWVSSHIKRLDAHTKECEEDRKTLHQTLTETKSEQIKHIKRTSELETILTVAHNCPHPVCPNRAFLKSTQRIKAHQATQDSSELNRNTTH